ncbi:MAG: hypothetical protein IT494_05700 [Gammaproteobacteria bacterium]|nr:hypothetical protein [Gammaproteobacteria bacterium]
MRYWLSLISLTLVSLPAPAAPTGADLERACSAALRDGFSTGPGLACLWYGTPCACDKSASLTARPQSCPPPNLDERIRAQVLIDGFAARPELRESPVEDAVATLFAERFPCTESTAKPQPPE